MIIRITMMITPTPSRLILKIMLPLKKPPSQARMLIMMVIMLMIIMMNDDN